MVAHECSVTVLWVGDRFVVACRRNVDGCKDCGGLVERFGEHVVKHPIRSHHVLRAPGQNKLLPRSAPVVGGFVLVVIGLDDFPICKGLAVLQLNTPRAVAQPRHEWRAGLVRAAHVHGDHSALVRLAPRYDEVGRRHQVQVVQLLHGRLEVRGGLHDLAHSEPKTPTVTVVHAVPKGVVSRVVTRVVLDAPPTEAHGGVNADASRPDDGGVQGFAATHEDPLGCHVGNVEHRAIHHGLETHIVQVAAVDHGSIGHGC
mmetsp:Transcript_54376/g.170908  ORF Transcript_54376/g.170908 Transcript_54376/m.170908 type:complete len:258 (+) Transcript_54376:115-888(+)